jgi:hypothetical protein
MPGSASAFKWVDRHFLDGRQFHDTGVGCANLEKPLNSFDLSGGLCFAGGQGTLGELGT